MITKMKFKGWSLLVILTIGVILQLTAPSKVWIMLLVGLGLTLAISFVWAYSLQESFRLTRERRYTWAQVGDRLEERFSISNYGKLPLPVLWAEISDESTLPGYEINQVRGLEMNASGRWHTQGVCHQRGIFQLGPTTVRLGDPFGLFEVRQTYPATTDFMIVPPVLPLPGISVAPHGQFGDNISRPFSPTRSQTASTVRPYQTGDRLNRIHWPTSARKESLYIRRLEERASGNWWLALDLNESAHFSSGLNSTLEKAILIASSLADKGLSQNHAVGLLAQGEEAVWLPPQANALQRWHILKRLAQVQGGTLSLADLLSRSRSLLAQKASLVIITASTSLQWLEPLLLLLHHGLTPTVILIFTEKTRQALESSYQILMTQGIKTHLVDSSALQVELTDPAAGQWEWHVTGMGKAVAIHKPEGQWERL